MADIKKVVEEKVVVNDTKLEGVLFSGNMTLVQKKKNFMGGVKADGTQDYYYNLTVTDGNDILSCTSTKVGESMQLGHTYKLGFNYMDKKLKLVSYTEVS